MEQSKKYVLWCALTAWAVTAAIVWFTPVAFCGYRTGNRLSALWLGLSYSGDVIGSAVILTVIGVVLARRQSSIRHKLKMFVAFVVPVGLTLALVAYVNECVTKPLTRLPRPSHKYLEEKGVIPIGLPAFYDKSNEERHRYLQEAVSRHKEKLQDVHPAVLGHWVHETAFSFPSGHALNAFLFATVLSYLLGTGKRRFLGWLPLLWAILVCLSRVALGVHTALDVTAGAMAGLLLSVVALMSRYLDYLVTEDN